MSRMDLLKEKATQTSIYRRVVALAKTVSAHMNFYLRLVLRWGGASCGRGYSAAAGVGTSVLFMCPKPDLRLIVFKTFLNCAFSVPFWCMGLQMHCLNRAGLVRNRAVWTTRAVWTREEAALINAKRRNILISVSMIDSVCP